MLGSLKKKTLAPFCLTKNKRKTVLIYASVLFPTYPVLATIYIRPSCLVILSLLVLGFFV
jgi:hypothetical protein